MLPSHGKSVLIRTPEGIAFRLTLAGPVSRFMAWLLDTFCVLAAVTVIAPIFQLISVFSESYGIALQVLLSFIISMGYGICLEWFWRGQTLGKRLLGLRVMDEQGLHLRVSQIIVRNLLRAVDGLPLFYLVGGLASAMSLKGQRLGDLAASTIVVRIGELAIPNLESLEADKYNSLREQPYLAARLRKKVSMDEASLVLRSLLRRDELKLESRAELYGKLAEHFKSLVPFPQECLEGLADERYLRNLADVLFRSRSARRP